MNRALVLEAVSDPVWQSFRESLKGRRTVSKLVLLHDYVEGTKADWCAVPVDARRIQAANYLNALARGGFVSLLKSSDRIVEHPSRWTGSLVLVLK